MWHAAWRPTATVVIHRSINVSGLERHYRLVVPRSLPPDGPLPVVFALHGALDTIDEMAHYTDLDDVCVRHRFVLVYLQGRLLNWPPSIPAHNPHLMEPDLEFFERMVDEVVQRHRGDPHRIYLVGVSQGGAMVNVIAANCSDRLAAAVCNCGWLPSPLEQTPLQTTYKCPMLFVVGADDHQVPPASVRVGYDAFTQAGHPTEFRVIPGHGHGWGKSLGMGEQMWTFLSRHRHP